MKKTSLLELAKKLNIPHRNYMKTREVLEKAIKGTITGYKEIIFGRDTPSCMACLDERWRQQVIDQKIYDQKLMEDTLRKLAWEVLQKILWWLVTQWSIRGQVRCWILKFIPHTGKTNFKLIFIVFIDHKITCRRVEKLHTLSGTGTLDTWSVSDFS